MSEELDEVWTEINDLRSELEVLKVKRQSLEKHQIELTLAANDLRNMADRSDAMAAEIASMLEGVSTK